MTDAQSQPVSNQNLPIHAEMSIPEIVDRFPATEAVFARHGLQVEGYRAIEHESLFATARVHQLPLQPLLAELTTAALAD
jgi:hypothetical protein